MHTRDIYIYIYTYVYIYMYIYIYIYVHGSKLVMPIRPEAWGMVWFGFHHPWKGMPALPCPAWPCFAMPCFAMACPALPWTALASWRCSGAAVGLLGGYIGAALGLLWGCSGLARLARLSLAWFGSRSPVAWPWHLWNTATRQLATTVGERMKTTEGSK